MEGASPGHGSGTGFHQISCFFGDLSHKKLVVSHYKTLGPVVVSFFSGAHRAWYVRTKHPELIPDHIDPNDRNLSEIFLFNVQSSVSFSFGYSCWLPNPLVEAPTGRFLSASRQMLSWMSSAAMSKLSRGELDKALEVYRFDSVASKAGFEMPFEQIDPVSDIPSQDVQQQLGWMLRARFSHGYPDIKGYERGGNGYTHGDASPWFISARARYDGTGNIGVRFPPRKSRFDNDPAGSDNGVWPVDGLWHPRNAQAFVGFRVHFWILNREGDFDDPNFRGGYYVTVVPKSSAPLGLYVDFVGMPGERYYFVVRRDVIWHGMYDPPPDYPSNAPDMPHVHTEL